MTTLAIGFLIGLVTWPVCGWLRKKFDVWIDRKFAKDDDTWNDWEN